MAYKDPARSGGRDGQCGSWAADYRLLRSSVTDCCTASQSAVTCTVAGGTCSRSDIAHTETATAGMFTPLKPVGTGYSGVPYAQASYECQ